MAFCTKCGATIPEGAQFCTVCGAPAGGAGPRRRTQSFGQPAPGPAQDSWDSYGNYGGYTPGPKPASSRSTLLRVLSVIFAVGFLVLAFGLGGMFYSNRQVEEVVDEYVETYYGGSRKPSEEDIRDFRDTYKLMMGPSLRCDPIGQLKALAESAKKSDPDRKEEIDKELDEVIKNLSSEDIRERRERMLKDRDEQIEEHGFRYVWLIISAYSTIFMIIGGALMVIALAAWIALGGTSGPLSQTTVLPVVIACCALGIILIAADLIIPVIKASD